MRCEVCDKEYPDDKTIVACVPGVPYSACYCYGCVGKNSHPMWAVVATTASCGGLANLGEEWHQIVNDSLTAQDKTMEWFLEQVKASEESLNNYNPPNDPPSPTSEVEDF